MRGEFIAVWSQTRRKIRPSPVGQTAVSGDGFAKVRNACCLPPSASGAVCGTIRSSGAFRADRRAANLEGLLLRAPTRRFVRACAS